MNNIAENSKSWPLVINKCALQLDRVHINLDRKLTFRCILKSVLSQKYMYGHFPAKHQVCFIFVSKSKVNLSHTAMQREEV
jgi:hypothetical protein